MIREIKKNIKLLIDPISELAFDYIPETKIYPHVVGHIAMDIVKEGLHNILLEFDIWDLGDSMANIEILEEKIISKLDRVKFFENGMSMVFYHQSSGYVQDSNTQIKRKTCSFELQARKGK